MSTCEGGGICLVIDADAGAAKPTRRAIDVDDDRPAKVEEYLGRDCLACRGTFSRSTE